MRFQLKMLPSLLLLGSFAWSVNSSAQPQQPVPVTPKPAGNQPATPSSSPSPVKQLQRKLPKSVKDAHSSTALQGIKRGTETETSQADDKPLQPVTGKDGLIARVNGEGIKLEEFTVKYDRFTHNFKARKKAIPSKIDARYRDSIVKRLIEERLIAQEAKKLKVKVDPKALQEEFDKYKAMFKTEERFQSYLQNAHLTVEKVKENLAQNLELQAVLTRLNGQNVTEAELRAYYDKNLAKYKVREQVKARHILIKTPKDATPEQIATAKTKADQIAVEAKKNPSDEAFAELAKKHSEGPTKSRGGDLSFFTKGRMVKEFDEKAFSMKVGEISDPVKTRFGWHIIRITERTDERTKPFEEVKDTILRSLENRANRTARQDLIQRLRSSAKIETYLP